MYRPIAPHPVQARSTLFKHLVKSDFPISLEKGACVIPWVDMFFLALSKKKEKKSMFESTSFCIVELQPLAVRPILHDARCRPNLIKPIYTLQHLGLQDWPLGKNLNKNTNFIRTNYLHDSLKRQINAFVWLKLNYLCM